MRDISKWDDVNLNKVLSEALAQKEALLTKFPKLQSLQDEIDSSVSPDQGLADKFLTMGFAHARFHSFPGV